MRKNHSTFNLFHNDILFREVRGTDGPMFFNALDPLVNTSFAVSLLPSLTIVETGRRDRFRSIPGIP